LDWTWIGLDLRKFGSDFEIKLLDLKNINPFISSHGGSSQRMSLNTSQFLAISDSFACFTLSKDQARLETKVIGVTLKVMESRDPFFGVSVSKVSGEACAALLCSHTFSVGLILEPREGWIVTS